VSDASRLHALDGLRAAMMLLGLVLHSAASYTFTPLGDAWPYRDRQTSLAFDLVVFVIHLFRMPTFYVMAGFFAALIYARGVRAFIVHRTRRVLVPLVVAWCVLYPLTGSGFVFAWNAGGDRLAAVWRAVTDGTMYEQLRLMHLWFLYDLLIFYAVAVLAAPLVERLPAGVRAGVARGVGHLVSRAWGVLLLAAVTAMTLVPMEVPALESSDAFLPPVRVLAAYFVFFAFGWLLFTRRDLVPRFGRHPWTHLGLALAASGAYLSIILRPPGPDLLTFHLTAVAVAALATWLFVFAITGLFVRYASRMSPVQRYLSDGSYWIYLVHLPFTIWLPGLMARWTAPAAVKFAVVLGVTTLCTVASYHLFVRNAALGAWLNGRPGDRGPGSGDRKTPGSSGSSPAPDP
jgi:peptidoglycan/LPS O-acetylase OafA/YrhL